MMNDLISRQAVLDIVDDLRDRMTVEGYWSVVERVKALATNLQQTCNLASNDCISRQAAIDALQDRYKLYSWDDGGAQKAEIGAIIREIYDMPSAQPERTCVNCGRTANNGGWYADGRTRCPIEEHYALPKDGYCHLWEKRNVTDDDYPERREE